jgi:hypothetical protein
VGSRPDEVNEQHNNTIFRVEDKMKRGKKKRSIDKEMFCSLPGLLFEAEDGTVSSPQIIGDIQPDYMVSYS